jgi:(1->4)-alpha-D-glucan 1-alpha-D-glucosylmutase
VQLHRGFTFDDAAALAPYLAALGVSHLYCSPILQASPGSTHGYDVVDHGRLSEELGGAAGFDRLADALAECGLSMIVDTVPNHMALAGSANRWWWDVLEDGPASRYADHFDIEWGDADAGPTVLMPILGDHIGREIEAGSIHLARRGGSFVVTYHDQELPLSPRSTNDILSRAAARTAAPDLAAIADDLGALPHAARTDAAAVDARHRGKVELRRRLAALCQLEPAIAQAVDDELEAVAKDPDALEALLARQNYRLARWRTGDEELDYRRFFSITTLAGVRVEHEEVFEESHRLLIDLVTSGRVTGLRIDHVDGLRDPAGYLRRLRTAMPEAYLVVEKILQHGEHLDEGWPVAGTSGYDHLVAIGDLFVDPDTEAAMTAGYQAFTGDTMAFDDTAHAAKLHVMREELAAETERLITLLAAVCAERRRHRDHTRRELRDALRAVLAALTVYRTYVVPGTAPAATDRAVIAAALEAARHRSPEHDPELLGLIGEVLLLDHHGEAETELAVRFQQLSAPVMAKGVEDTAFYRHHRLVSLNEVGGDPGTFGRPVAAFHDHCARLARQWPDTMVTLATHDTKRSADVRARISLLAEMPTPWWQAVTRWAEHNDRHRDGGTPDRGAELLLYQTLVGAWPITTDRAVAAMVKSAKEAKLHTSWTAPDQCYDDAVVRFTSAVLADAEFVADLETFLDDHRVVELGRVSSLAQTTLLATAPGVPDVYQGTELWDLSLVDPDNRRPVDHAQRAALLEVLVDAPPEVALAHLEDGGTKLWLLAQILRHRRRHPRLYGGDDHHPLAAEGPKARHVVAFDRGGLLVVVPRLVVGLGDDWAGTSLTVPPGAWVDVLTGEDRRGGPYEVAELLERVPVCVLATTAA